MKSDNKLFISDYAPGYLTHFGLILSNLSIVVTIIAFLSMFTVFIPALYWIGLILIVLCSIGTIFIVDPNFGRFFTDGSEIVVSFYEKVTATTPTLAIVGCIMVACSFVILLLDKRERYVGRKVYSILMAIVMIIELVIVSGVAL